MNRNPFVLSAVFAGLLFALPCAQAQNLNFTLTVDPDPTLVPGKTYHFDSLLLNKSQLPLDLLDGNLDVTRPGIPNDNFINTPLELNSSNGNTWSGDLFDVTVPAGTPPDTTIMGSYTIDYALAGSSKLQTATQNFVLTTAVPEVGSDAGLAFTVVGGVLYCMRRRRVRNLRAASRKAEK